MDDARVNQRSRVSYDGDFFVWALDQAIQLRLAAEGMPASLDWENLAEEIEALVKRDKRELASHIAIVLEHLLKLQASPAAAPRDGWEQSVSNARRQIGLILDDSPSLRNVLADLVTKALPGARRSAARALARHAELSHVVPHLLDYTPEQVVDDWWPSALSSGG